MATGEPGASYRVLPGPGPAYPLIAADYSHSGAIRIQSSAGQPADGWWILKTLWWIRPSEAREVLVRSRRLDGSSQLLMGVENGAAGIGRAQVDIETAGGTGTYSDETLFQSARDVLNIINGWRTYPGGTAMRDPGCYAFQVDGKSFSYTIVFKAVL